MKKKRGQEKLRIWRTLISSFLFPWTVGKMAKPEQQTPRVEQKAPSAAQQRHLLVPPPPHRNQMLTNS